MVPTACPVSASTRPARAPAGNWASSRPTPRHHHWQRLAAVLAGEGDHVVRATPSARSGRQSPSRNRASNSRRDCDTLQVRYSLIRPSCRRASNSLGGRLLDHPRRRVPLRRPDQAEAPHLAALVETGHPGRDEFEQPLRQAVEGAGTRDPLLEQEEFAQEAVAGVGREQRPRSRGSPPRKRGRPRGLESERLCGMRRILLKSPSIMSCRNYAYQAEPFFVRASCREHPNC